MSSSIVRDGVHLHVAALVAFDRVSDGDVLSQFQ